MPDEQKPRSNCIDPWYVTGYVEGVGCFTFSRNGNTLALYFAMKGTAADRGALEEVREFFGGAGRIYDLARAGAPVVGTTPARGVLYYRVTRLSDLRVVVEHFQRYPLRGAKAGAYRIWREMFEVKCAQVRRPASASLDDLARRLSRLSRRSGRAAAGTERPHETE